MINKIKRKIKNLLNKKERKKKLEIVSFYRNFLYKDIFDDTLYGKHIDYYNNLLTDEKEYIISLFNNNILKMLCLNKKGDLNGFKLLDCNQGSIFSLIQKWFIKIIKLKTYDEFFTIEFLYKEDMSDYLKRIYEILTIGYDYNIPYYEKFIRISSHKNEHVTYLYFLMLKNGNIISMETDEWLNTKSIKTGNYYNFLKILDNFVK